MPWDCRAKAHPKGVCVVHRHRSHIEVVRDDNRDNDDNHANDNGTKITTKHATAYDIL